MRPAFCAAKASSSSARWVRRQSQDPFVKGKATDVASGAPAYRSRSAFKLESIQAKYPFLLSPRPPELPEKIVVDLGAAPGGWSQLASYKLGERGKVFALDILPFERVPAVHMLQGDFLARSTQEALNRAIIAYRPKQFGMPGGGYEEVDSRSGPAQKLVDVVLSDMMSPMSGNRTRDVQLSLQLVEAASTFAIRVLKDDRGEATWLHHGKLRYPGGHYVVKFFQHPELDAFKDGYLKPRFHKIVVDKPKESRKESSEAYWVCLGYKGEPKAD